MMMNSVRRAIKPRNIPQPAAALLFLSRVSSTSSELTSSSAAAHAIRHIRDRTCSEPCKEEGGKKEEEGKEEGSSKEK